MKRCLPLTLFAAALAALASGSPAMCAALGSEFSIDGVFVRVDQVKDVAAFADGSPADPGSRVVEVTFRLRNATSEKINAYDFFYAYAVLRDGSDTKGDPLSYFPLDSSKEITEFSLKPNQTVRERFDMEVPSGAKLARLVIYGPIDGAMVSIPL